MKWKIFVLILVVITSIGIFAYLKSDGIQSTNITPTISGGEILVVSPQEARTAVKIDQAMLTQGGYIVVRGSDGKRLGQIIEISRYLKADEHEDIVIDLGDFYSYSVDDQLIAMIYHDDGDKTFNDLDQPLKATPAVFIKTGKSVPPSVLEQQVAALNGMGMETVRYTNDGFQPAKLTVPVGTMVEFINQSDEPMWVASNVHPEHEMLPTFDQFKEVSKGQSYMYTFDKKGIWPYHDHINASIEGEIIVE